MLKWDGEVGCRNGNGMEKWDWDVEVGMGCRSGIGIEKWEWDV